MATGRAMARPVVLADGKVLIAGGATTIASGVTYELLDVGTGQVTPAGVPVRNRVGHTATRLADGRVLIAGGFEDDSAELWDPATRSARPVAARMANPREWHSATLLADGRVLLVGGYTVAAAYWFAEIFDPQTEQFAPISTPRLAPQVESLALHVAPRLAAQDRRRPARDVVGRRQVRRVRLTVSLGRGEAAAEQAAPALHRDRRQRRAGFGRRSDRADEGPGRPDPDERRPGRAGRAGRQL
jgi:hypothetical protein